VAQLKISKLSAHIITYIVSFNRSYFVGFLIKAKEDIQLVRFFQLYEASSSWIYLTQLWQC